MSAAAADSAVHPRETSRPLRIRLCLMMFLQYFVQGCYLPIASVYLRDALGFSTAQVGVFGSALAAGPLLAPFALGQLVDRRYATQHVLAVSHLAAAGVMLLLWIQRDYWPVVLLGTLYALLYVPSLMLTNSLTFHHLADREREFPLVRLWGTIGFIVPAWLIEAVFLRNVTGEAVHQARGIALATAGVAGLVMAAYALTLPHTPPVPRTDRRFAPGVAAALVRQRTFFVLVSITFLIAVIHKFYFVLNSPFLRDLLERGGVTGAWEQRIASLGQFAEIAVMAVLGAMLTRLGFKRTMTVGAAAYLVRSLVFVAADQIGEPFWLVIGAACAGQFLHGLCFACFLAAAFIFVDRTTPSDIRGSVQNLYGTFVVGLGFFAGGFFSGWIGDLFPENWTMVWLTSAGVAAVCVGAMVLAFPRDLPK